MACLDMYNQNPDHKAAHCGAPPMSPRISFSNDFAESNHTHHHHHMIKTKSRSEGPVSSDFEFSSISNHSMMSADELFSKGRLLPFKDSCTKTTLREELLIVDDEDDVSMTRPPRGSSIRWKELLGLRKNQNHNGGSKKCAKNDGFVEKSPCLAHEDSKSSQDMVNDGGSSCRDVEFGM